MTKENRDIEVDGPLPPNPLTIGGRLRSERERLRLALPSAARLMGMPEKALTELEASSGGGQFASALPLLAYAGWDVLFIVTGIRNQIGKADGRAPGDRFRHALEDLSANERQRLLLHFVAEELRYVLSQK
jgi:transcriptional regulator with XRE-family HTH domain